MPPPTPNVTDAELRVLHALWDRGPSTIRKLTDRLYPGGGQSSYATVQKLLDRLEEADCVARDRSAMTHVFVAAVSRDDFIGGQLRGVAVRLCGRSVHPPPAHLLETSTNFHEDRKGPR